MKGKLGRALGDQIRSIDKSRLKTRLGRLTADEMARVDEALAVTLNLPLIAGRRIEVDPIGNRVVGPAPAKQTRQHLQQNHASTLNSRMTVEPELLPGSVSRFSVKVHRTVAYFVSEGC